MKNLILSRIKETNCNYSFEIFKENVAKLKDDDYVVFVKYVEEENYFLVFDGGYTIVECEERFLNNKKEINRVKNILLKYDVKKEEGSQPLYLEAKAEQLQEKIALLIKVEKEILG